MPQRCSVCIHENVDEINYELLRGTPLRKIAEQYGVSSTALFWHKNTYWPHLYKPKKWRI